MEIMFNSTDVFIIAFEYQARNLFFRETVVSSPVRRTKQVPQII